MSKQNSLRNVLGSPQMRSLIETYFEKKYSDESAYDRAHRISHKQKVMLNYQLGVNPGYVLSDHHYNKLMTVLCQDISVASFADTLNLIGPFLDGALNDEILEYCVSEMWFMYLYAVMDDLVTDWYDKGKPDILQKLNPSYLYLLTHEYSQVTAFKVRYTDVLGELVLQATRLHGAHPKAAIHNDCWYFVILWLQSVGEDKIEYRYHDPEAIITNLDEFTRRLNWYWGIRAQYWEAQDLSPDVVHMFAAEVNYFIRSLDYAKPKSRYSNDPTKLEEAHKVYSLVQDTILEHVRPVIDKFVPAGTPVSWLAELTPLDIRVD